MFWLIKLYRLLSKTNDGSNIGKQTLMNNIKFKIAINIAKPTLEYDRSW